MSAAALVPTSVTGITTQIVENQIQVNWKAVSDDISYYRVYFSSESILNNNGLYDDFERTTGPETTLLFPRPNSAPEIFVAVIAVNKNNEESEFFTQESSVRFGSITVSSTSSAPRVASFSSAPPIQWSSAASIELVPPPQQQSSAATFSSLASVNPVYTGIGEDITLLSADPLSATGILIRFSAPITVDPMHASEGLHIFTATNEQLPISRITINGNEMMIYTQMQTRGVVYKVEVKAPFMGPNQEEIDPTGGSALFAGHETGLEPSSSSGTTVRVVDPYYPPDIANLVFTPRMQANGSYSLVAEWTVDNSPKDLAHYLIYQTRDRGQTFSGPTILPIDIRGVQLDGVTPGEYGLAIQTLNIYGYLSKGVFQNVLLPTPGVSQNPFQGNILLGNEELIDDEGKLDVNDEQIAQLVPATKGDEGVFPKTGSGATYEIPHAAAPVKRGWANQTTAIVLLGLGTLLAAGSSLFYILSKKSR